MSTEKRSLNILEFGRRLGVASRGTARPSRQEAARLPEFRRPGESRRPSDMISQLLTHQARVRRSMKPLCEIKLRVLNPNGEPAVEFGF